MKFFIKIIAITISIQANTYASQINILYEDVKPLAIKALIDHFESNYGVPKSLISTRRVRSCTVFDKRFLEICINRKGNLIEIPNINKKDILKSLSVFKTQES